MSVASSNGSPDSLGAAMKRRNSRDLLHKYFRPRQVMSFNPLVDQLAMDVNRAALGGGERVFHKSVTTGCRVGNHLKRCVGTGNIAVPTFSPKVNNAW